MRRFREKGPPALLDGEATHIWPEAIPSAVVLHVKRDRADERRAGHAPKAMFCELSLSEAVEHHRKLGEAIAQAGAMGWRTPGGDSAPLL